MTPTTTTTEAEELEILKTDVLGRVRMPRAKRELILERFEGSGMSGQAFPCFGDCPRCRLRGKSRS